MENRHRPMYLGRRFLCKRPSFLTRSRKCRTPKLHFSSEFWVSRETVSPVKFRVSQTSLNPPDLQDFNVSGNRLSGEIPRTLSTFSESSFRQNSFLCGAPLEKCKAEPNKPGSEGAIATSPLVPSSETPTTTTTVSSSPSTMPTTTPTTTNPKSHEKRASKMSPIVLIAIIVGDILVLGIVCLLLYCYFWRNYSSKSKERKGLKLFESEKIVYSSSPYPTQGGFERGRMVFFEGEKRFELEDLLRASAEMLGKGGFGTAYKAVLDDGNVVAVKRLKDAQIAGKREFEQHMEVLGRIRHPNVVSLRAYYFAREEKLLVYDFMPNATLFWLLHGILLLLLLLLLLLFVFLLQIYS